MPRGVGPRCAERDEHEARKARSPFPTRAGKRPVRTPVSKNIGSGGVPADVPSPPAQFCSESKGTPKGGYVQVVSLRLWDRFLSCVWRSETRAPRVRFDGRYRIERNRILLQNRHRTERA